MLRWCRGGGPHGGLESNGNPGAHTDSPPAEHAHEQSRTTAGMGRCGGGGEGVERIDITLSV